LELAKAPVSASWQRSVFNGLAQVIVQSASGAGDIQLKASADGLAAGTVVIRTGR